MNRLPIDALNPTETGAARVQKLFRTTAFKLSLAYLAIFTLCAFLALLLWGLFGSLVMGLRSPATANPASAMLWLAGAVGITAIALALGSLAGHAKG